MNKFDNSPIFQRSLANIAGILSHVTSFCCALVTYGIAALALTSFMGLVSDEDPLFHLSGNDAGIAITFSLFLYVMTIRVSIGLMHYAGAKFEEAVLWQHMIKGDPKVLAEVVPTKKALATKEEAPISIKGTPAVASEKIASREPKTISQPAAAKAVTAESKQKLSEDHALVMTKPTHAAKLAQPAAVKPASTHSSSKPSPRPGVLQDKQNAGLKVARTQTKPPITKKKESAAARLISFVLGSSSPSGSMPVTRKPMNVVNKSGAGIKAKNA